MNLRSSSELSDESSCKYLKIIVRMINNMYVRTYLEGPSSLLSSEEIPDEPEYWEPLEDSSLESLPPPQNLLDYNRR
jgi:hypothetical protein